MKINNQGCDNCKFRYTCDLPSFDSPGGCGLYDYDWGTEPDNQIDVMMKYDPRAFEIATELVRQASMMTADEKLQQLKLIAEEMQLARHDGDHEFRKYVGEHADAILDIIVCPKTMCNVCGEYIEKGQARVPLIKTAFYTDDTHIPKSTWYTNIWTVHPQCKHQQLTDKDYLEWSEYRFRLR
jgi:hypothetical protein